MKLDNPTMANTPGKVNFFADYWMPLIMIWIRTASDVIRPRSGGSRLGFEFGYLQRQ
jgi:hypothetical protein